MDLLLIAISGATLVWGILIYNWLVRDKNRVLAAWSDIDVQLKRRHDLIPKLVDAVRAYTSYESSLLAEITRIRASNAQTVEPAKTARIEGQITAQVRDLMAVAEAYPDLKSSEHFLDLQRNLTHVEEQIQYARRYYNGSVRNLNVRIDSFPDLLIARAFGFEPAEFFELTTTAEANVPETRA
jgi:LemA protein